jgi:hypothetical protein
MIAETDTTRQTIKISGVVQSRAGRFENCILASTRIVFPHAHLESRYRIILSTDTPNIESRTRIVSHSPFFIDRKGICDILHPV